MIKLDCILSRVSDVEVPHWLSTAPGQLSSVFATASESDINLVVDNRLAELPVRAQSAVDAYDLHTATARLARNASPPARVTSVVVLFAGSYAWTSDVFGIMFDRGVTTEDDPNNNDEFLSNPREGCAVFLDTIRQRRTQDADFERETLFTTIHEMGHLFNLQHVSGKSYLASSLLTEPFDFDYHQFTATQKLALSNCSSSPYVWPGGSKFGSTGSFGSTNRLVEPRRKSPVGLTLSLELPCDRFWPFEPIELDIVLRADRSARNTFRVLDRIDPGYEEFRIWIDQPSGERRLYRSPRRYCAYPSRRVLSREQGFRRDVSFFAEAGGLTFRQAGIYRVWAEFMAGANKWVRAAPVEFEIMGADRSRLYDATRTALGAGRASRLLYHRRLQGSPHTRRMEEFVADHTRWTGIARVEYGLGRALIHASRSRSGAQARMQASKGISLLKRAVDSKHLGTHQRARAMEIMDGIRQS